MERYEEIKKYRLNGSQLKWIAILTMTIDHIGAFLLEPALASGLASNRISFLNMIFRLIGRLAFPIFTFLLVEGFIHTRNVQKYLLQMGIFSLISEIPFDLAKDGVLVEFSHQNVFFTLFIGLLTISLFDQFKASASVKWSIPILGMVTASALQTDYSAIGILIIFVFYYFRTEETLRNIVVSPLLFLQVTAVLALIPIQFYNEERGKQNKYFFYLFYPMHLLLLYIIQILLFK